MAKFFSLYGSRPGVVAIDFKDSPSVVRQEFAFDSDINNILKRYATTGWLVDPSSPRNDRKPTYDDWSKAPSYQDSLDIVIKAEEKFDALPVQIRQRFNYNPQALLNFLADPKNYDEAVALRLISPKPSKIQSQAAAAASPEPPEAAKAASAAVAVGTIPNT